MYFCLYKDFLEACLNFDFEFLKPFKRIKHFGILPKCIFVFDRPNLFLFQSDGIVQIKQMRWKSYFRN